MPAKDMTTEVRALLDLLGSTEQLEVLLFLLRAPSTAHLTDTIGQTLGISRQETETAARMLQRKRLIVSVPMGPTDVGYQYAPGTIDLHAAVEGLAVAYDKHPGAVIKALYEKPDTTLSTFADAFRVRRHNKL